MPEKQAPFGTILSLPPSLPLQFHMMQFLLNIFPPISEAWLNILFKW